MNDQRFFDLAVKSIARQSTHAERAELDSLLAAHPEFNAELERLRAEANLAKEVLPLLAATEATTGELPGYARERLQTKVRQTLGRPVLPEVKPNWTWRWLLVLVPAAALLVLLVIPLLTRSSTPVVQVAMLDVAGDTRSLSPNQVAALEETWKGVAVRTFDKAADLEAWGKNWPGDKRPVAKVIYDRPAGEVRVIGHSNGKTFQKTFPVDADLAETLHQADTFIQQQTKM